MDPTIAVKHYGINSNFSNTIDYIEHDQHATESSIVTYNLDYLGIARGIYNWYMILKCNNSN